YGSCCATFVSEVFGGSFMNGANPRFDGVYTLRNSSYALTTYSVKAVDLQPGDAVSNPDSAHIVWIGDVTDTDFVVYEQTPPVARKILVPKTSVDENGYLTISYDGKAKVFNVVTKSRDAAAPETYELSKTYAAPIKAYTINTGKTLVMDRVGGNAKYNKIYDTDICTIDEIYENGWCHVVFPLDAGGEDDGYVTFDTFLAGAALDTATISCDSTTYARADCMDDFGYVVAGTTVTITEQSGGVIQILYRDLAGDQRLAWIEETAIQQETAIIPGDVTGDGVVNGADLIRLRKYLAAYNNETGACDVEIAPGADVNEDGAVNGKDLIRLRKQLAAME
ncbi:MAG: dockerin type I repeat-containing protein, partial [Clostridia bacterium]|nr:dockerin type I repeat-containing protein [Clostridia bacterium]